MAQLNIKKMSPQFLVKDIEQSIEFYIKKLGFELDFFYDGFYAGIVKDGHSIHLKSGQPNKEERENKKENNHPDIVFGVEAADALHDELVNKNVEIIRPLCDQPYGREFYISDPDGYILAFLE